MIASCQIVTIYFFLIHPDFENNYIFFFLYNNICIIVGFLSFCSLEKIRSPLLILHAEDDHIVPIHMAEQVR